MCPSQEQIVSTVNAIIGAINLGSSQVESASSVGAQVRAQVRRGASTLQTTSGAVNTGASQFLTYSVTLQNGDVVAIHASDNGFGAFDEDVRTIPTPQFAFTPDHKIKFDDSPVLVPNSAGGDNIAVSIILTDGSGATATLALTGTRNAVNALNNSVAVPVDGVNGAFTLTTAFGNVFLNASYNTGYDASRNETAEVSVTDHVNWTNVTHDFGRMNAILEDPGTYIADGNGSAIIWF